MFKGPTGPQSGRTPRTQAEKLGTSPGGFSEQPGYDPTAGTPTGKDYPSSTYKERELKSPSGGKPMEIPTPFSGGSK